MTSQLMSRSPAIVSGVLNSSPVFIGVQRIQGLLIRERLDVSGFPLPGSEAVRLDDAVEDGVLPHDGFHGPEYRGPGRSW